jgi:hypothetical protein
VNIGAFQASAAFFALAAPGTVTAGQPFDVTVTALDSYGQTAVGYIGNVDLNSSDPAAGYLGSHAFTLVDGGAYTFAGVTLYTEGPQTLWATDGVLVGQFDLTVVAGNSPQMHHASGKVCEVSRQRKERPAVQQCRPITVEGWSLI